MRWLLTIWAFYLLVLAAIPCSDASNGCENSTAKTEKAHAHNHSQDKDDICTPFCFCSCCSVSIVSFNYKPLEFTQPLEVLIPHKIALLNDALISSYFRNIWLPPKVNV